MEEPQRNLDAIRNKLGFLYNESAMSKYRIKCWLKEDEFVERVWDEIRRGVRINDEVLLSIVKPLYEDFVSNPERHPNFSKTPARRGIYQLERACGQVKIQ